MFSNYYWIYLIDFLYYNREEILSITTKNVDIDMIIYNFA
jgi:hypothetical protein